MTLIRKLWTKVLLIPLRRAILKRHFTKCGAGFTPLGSAIIVNEGTFISGVNFVMRSFSYLPIQIRIHKNAKLVIGNNVFINQGVRISCSCAITIGDACQIGDEVLMLDQNWHPVGQADVKRAPIIIEEQTWIAARVVVLPGVTIGKGSVIAAGAVVTRPIPPFTLAAGVPAKPIRSLSTETENGISYSHD